MQSIGTEGGEKVFLLPESKAEMRCDRSCRQGGFVEKEKNLLWNKFTTGECRSGKNIQEKIFSEYSFDQTYI